jgi:hypothetical protein
MMDLLLHLCLWCSPVRVRCYFVGGIDTCYVSVLDNKAHVIKALGLPAMGLRQSGHGWSSFTGPPPALLGRNFDPRPGAQNDPPTFFWIDQVEIDGRTKKVKRAKE